MSPVTRRMSTAGACLAVASSAALLAGLTAVPASATVAAVTPPVTPVSSASQSQTIPLVAPGDSGMSIGHRGNSSVAPENTMAAIVSSFRGGSDYVEIDIDYTSDGVPVIIHDDSVDRTTDGTGNVRDLTYEYISTLDAGSWFDEGYAGMGIPTLADALAFMTRSDAKLLIEYKGDWSEEMVAVTAGMIADAGLNDNALTMSFSEETTGLLQKAAPDIDRLILATTIPVNPVEHAEQYGALGMSVTGQSILLTPGAVEEMNTAGLAVFAWTVNDAPTWNKLTSLGIEGITTNNPDRLVGWNLKHDTVAKDGSQVPLPVEPPVRVPVAVSTEAPLPAARPAGSTVR